MQSAIILVNTLQFPPKKHTCGVPITSQTTTPSQVTPDAKRTVTWLTESTVILKETFPTNSGTIEKEKLVHLYPDRLMWVSTHLSGPNKYSQFLYQITPEVLRLLVWILLHSTLSAKRI